MFTKKWAEKVATQMILAYRHNKKAVKEAALKEKTTCKSEHKRGVKTSYFNL